MDLLTSELDISVTAEADDWTLGLISTFIAELQWARQRNLGRSNAITNTEQEGVVTDWGGANRSRIQHQKRNSNEEKRQDESEQ